MREGFAGPVQAHLPPVAPSRGVGQSAPTNSEAFQAFEARYAAFRRELKPDERAWFDEVVCEARRHTTAINRYPHLDFERPMMLSVLVGIMRRFDDVHAGIEDELREAQRQLRGAGLLRRPLSCAESQVRLDLTPT